MTIYLIIINILAAFGILFIIYIVEEFKKERKKKREEKFEQDVRKALLDVLDKIEEEEK